MIQIIFGILLLLLLNVPIFYLMLRRPKTEVEAAPQMEATPAE